MRNFTLKHVLMALAGEGAAGGTSVDLEKVYAEGTKSDANADAADMDAGDDFDPAQFAEDNKNGGSTQDQAAQGAAEEEDDGADAGDAVDQGADAAAAADAVEGEGEGEAAAEQARDENGRFAAKDKPEDKPQKPIPNMVPRDRLREEAERRRAAERQLERERYAEQHRNDLAQLESKRDELEAKEIKAMEESDMATLRQVRAEARKVDVAIADVKADARATQIADQRFEQHKFESAVAEVMAAHPELDQSKEGHDQGLIDEVNDLMNSLAPKYGKEAALRRAVGYVMGVETATRAPAALGQKSTQAKVREERKTEGAKKTAAAVKAQPPSASSVTTGKGNAVTPSGAPKTIADISKMSDAELARWSGDTL